MITVDAPSNRPFLVQTQRFGVWQDHHAFAEFSEARECYRCLWFDNPGRDHRVVHFTGGPLGPELPRPPTPPLPNLPSGQYARRSRAQRERFNLRSST